MASIGRNMLDRLLQEALRHSGLALAIIDSNGRIEYQSPAFSRIVGLSDSDLLGSPIAALLPVASENGQGGFTAPSASDTALHELNGLNLNGKIIDLEIESTHWTNEKGHKKRTVILRDITDRHSSLPENQDKLSLSINAVRGARIGVFEYRPAVDKVIVSDIWRELLEIYSANSDDVQAEWRARVHPDDLLTALEPMRLCIENNAATASCEYRLRSGDGSTWRWWQTDVSVGERARDGTAVRVIGAVTEITARRHVEDALRHSVAQFRSAFESAPIGKAIVNLNGSFLRVNPALCSFLGFSEAELLTTNFQSLTHADDLRNDLAQLELLKAGKIESYQNEKRYIRSNGATVWGLLSVGVVRNAEGKPVQFVSQILDVTEHRRLNELKNEFVATVSHELRTPLTSVLGALSLLTSMESVELPDAAQRLLFIAEQNGKRLSALINDILDFEKFSAGEMRFNLSRHRISCLAEDALLANMSLVDTYGVTFQIDAPDRNLWGKVDPKRFQQVMANLLSNAAKFANPGSMIVVTTEKEDQHIKVSVSNTGPGIPESFRDKIFRPFSQAAASSTRSRGGTGLGLSITRQIVEKTGGTMGFSSVPDEMTTFWFTIPHDPA